jgi:hypothetical protein
MPRLRYLCWTTGHILMLYGTVLYSLPRIGHKVLYASLKKKVISLQIKGYRAYTNETANFFQMCLQIAFLLHIGLNSQTFLPGRRCDIWCGNFLVVFPLSCGLCHCMSIIYKNGCETNVCFVNKSWSNWSICFSVQFSSIWPSTTCN